MRYKVAFAIFILIMSFIGFKYNSKNLHNVLLEEQSISSKINSIKNNIYSIDKETLKLSFFLYNNYDDINRLIKRLDKQTKEFDSKELTKLIEEKKTNIYHFEILNSPLKNSIFYTLLLNKKATSHIKDKQYLKKLSDTIFDMIVLKSVNDKLILERFLKDYSYFKNFKSSDTTENNFNGQILSQLDVFRKYYSYYKKYFNALFQNENILNELNIIHAQIKKKLQEKKVSFSHFAIFLQAILFLTLLSLLYFMKKFSDEHKKLQIISKTDKLTKLLNRYSFDTDQQELSHAVLFLINIDNFRHFNESYGVETGNHILKEFSMIIKNIDIGYDAKYYRLGGDDFGVLIDSKDLDIDAIAQKYLGEIASAKITYNDLRFEIDASIGISQDAPLFQNADIALKKVKSDKNLNYYLYDKRYGEQIKESIKSNIEKISILKNSIKDNSVLICLQPIVDLDSGEVLRYEALSRIVNVDKIDSIFPYLDVAKTSKIYIDISTQIISKCFDILKEYQNVNISINLSIQDILSDDINRLITDFLDNNTKDMGERITFELLESEMIEDFNIIEEFIMRVKAHSVKIAIDDFGSGYSNFEYLVKLHTDILKIDGSLIKDIHENRNNFLIVSHITKLAKELGMVVVAEFVSDEEVAKIVKELGIDLAQGYLYGKPFYPEKKDFL